MSSGLFSIARSALITHQTALQTISQNIANAETPGYSRQEAVLVANTPVRMPYGNVGTGVHVETIVRKRDLLLDETYRSAEGQASSTELRRDMLGQVESIFGEPTDAGMTNALDQFWTSWSDLSSNPSSGSSRTVVQQRGRQVAQLFNDYDTQLTQQRTSSYSRLENTVSQINSLASQVAELNNRIVSAETGGDMANDLRDKRDLALDSLSKLAGTRVINQADGTVSVIIGNSTLVDSTTARPVSLQLDPPVPPPAVTPADIPVKIRLGTSPDRLQPLGGELKSLVDVINTEIPAIRGRLDAMASSLATAINTAHSAGFVFSGTTIPGTAAGNFFDPGTVLTPVRASTLRLDSTIAADPSQIAASGNANAPTDNAAALALSALRTTNATVSYTAPNGVVETGTFLGFFRNTVTALGINTKAADDDASIYRTLADQGEARRQSVSGVSTDEELVNMLRVQQSYTAATKLIKTADEMLQTLLQLV
ncbi:MAG: flagellar hook-associated protein FlgK [Gemmatimonadaceae bacterium]|jgi:flagellar hook-associated protein 1 FlgK|nr:flagellar hook-associated protein FlgK [Gemmatimonadaceae bacterium]